jgi:hypothetical protein
MCTSIVEIARAEGMAKRGDEWFPLSQAVVAYDHARHAPLGDVITLDFINTDLDPGARAGIELTLETAKELSAALDRAIAAAEFEEAQIRGKGVLPSQATVFPKSPADFSKFIPEDTEKWGKVIRAANIKAD